MMKAIILLADGFEEIEAITPIDVLRRAGVEVCLAGVANAIPGKAAGAHGVTLASDCEFAMCSAGEWDLVILPGGLPGATNLRDHSAVCEFVVKAWENGACIAAICAAPIVLEKAGLLAGRRATSYPSFQSHLVSAKISDNAVECEDRIVTSQGVGTAFDFSFKLLDILGLKKEAEQLQQAMLVTLPR